VFIYGRYFQRAYAGPSKRGPPSAEKMNAEFMLAAFTYHGFDSVITTVGTELAQLSFYLFIFLSRTPGTGAVNDGLRGLLDVPSSACFQAADLLRSAWKRTVPVTIPRYPGACLMGLFLFERRDRQHRAKSKCLFEMNTLVTSYLRLSHAGVSL
jgi:hypothetical protein